MKVLVVENDIFTAIDIKENICSFGEYEVEISSSFYDAVEKFKEHLFDIAILDIGLDGEKTGIDVAKEIKKIKNTPIVYLTGTKADELMKDAISTKPVSYVLKPFDEVSLKAALLLALENVEDRIFNLRGDYYYSVADKKLYKNKDEIKLTNNEIQLLDLVVTSRGNLISYETIENEIWGYKAISQSTIRTFLYRFKDKLSIELFETISGRGIQLIK